MGTGSRRLLHKDHDWFAIFIASYASASLIITFSLPMLIDPRLSTPIEHPWGLWSLLLSIPCWFAVMRCNGMKKNWLQDRFKLQRGDSLSLGRGIATYVILFAIGLPAFAVFSYNVVITWYLYAVLVGGTVYIHGLHVPDIRSRKGNVRGKIEFLRLFHDDFYDLIKILGTLGTAVGGGLAVYATQLAKEVFPNSADASLIATATTIHVVFFGTGLFWGAILQLFKLVTECRDRLLDLETPSQP